jgi:uridylate kinase
MNKSINIQELIVIKLSGSLFNNIKPKLLKAFAKLFIASKESGRHPIIITGGGVAARNYIYAAKRMGSDQASLDELGIELTRIHARLFIAAIGKSAYPYPPLSLEEAVKAVETGKIVVAGGFQPGQSTNAVAALLAEKLKATLLINATDVDGVYQKDPTQYRDAEKLARITPRQLSLLLKDLKADAGTYDLMDPLALKIIERSKIKTRILRCTPADLGKALEGRNVGTLVIE